MTGRAGPCRTHAFLARPKIQMLLKVPTNPLFSSLSSPTTHTHSIPHHHAPGQMQQFSFRPAPLGRICTTIRASQSAVQDKRLTSLGWWSEMGAQAPGLCCPAQGWHPWTCTCSVWAPSVLVDQAGRVQCPAILHLLGLRDCRLLGWRPCEIWVKRHVRSARRSAWSHSPAPGMPRAGVPPVPDTLQSKIKGEQRPCSSASSRPSPQPSVRSLFLGFTSSSLPARPLAAAGVDSALIAVALRLGAMPAKQAGRRPARWNPASRAMVPGRFGFCSLKQWSSRSPCQCT